MDKQVLQYRNRILEKIGIERFFGKKILDVGCGDGGDALLISQYARSIIGVDSQENDGWKISRGGKIDFQVADACNLPFGGGSFDVVFSKDILHHIANHDKALSEMLRVTSSNGAIIILEANRYNPITYIHMTLMLGHQHFTKKYFKKLISQQAQKVNFFSLESRVIPVNNKLLWECFNLLEFILGKIAFLNNYNLAIITKA